MIDEIEVDELEPLVNDGAVLVDVREPDEVAEVRVPGVLPIPLGEIGERMAEIPEADTVYVICKSGGRSMRACEALVDAGRRAVNVAGGTTAWADSGLPTESDR